jgi:hypothetical protein
MKFLIESWICFGNDADGYSRIQMNGKEIIERKSIIEVQDHIQSLGHTLTGLDDDDMGGDDLSHDVWTIYVDTSDRNYSDRICTPQFHVMNITND